MAVLHSVCMIWDTASPSTQCCNNACFLKPQTQAQRVSAITDFYRITSHLLPGPLQQWCEAMTSPHQHSLLPPHPWTPNNSPLPLPSSHRWWDVLGVRGQRPSCHAVVSHLLPEVRKPPLWGWAGTCVPIWQRGHTYHRHVSEWPAPPAQGGTAAPRKHCRQLGLHVLMMV